ncbi:MAG: alpha/beta hydrolase [Oscillospiraceae bacterium]
MKELFIKSHDGLKLSVGLFEVENPIGLVQIIHGMKEHKKRYYPFAEYLQSLGYAVIVSDNRGHGQSLNDDYFLGNMNGCEEIIQDQYIITKYIKKLYPDKDLFLIGHSFGSLLARCYLQKHDDEIKKLVLTGTVNYINLVGFGLKVGNLIKSVKGEKGYSKFLKHFGDINDDSWICSDTKILESVRNDNLCTGYQYTNGAILTIWEADKQLHEIKNFQFKNKDLEILSVVGAEDPVTGGEKGIADTIRTLHEIGYTNIKSIIYPKMKHEVLNEIGKEKVYKDIKTFLEC